MNKRKAMRKHKKGSHKLQTIWHLVTFYYIRQKNRAHRSSEIVKSEFPMWSQEQ